MIRSNFQAPLRPLQRERALLIAPCTVESGGTAALGARGGHPLLHESCLPRARGTRPRRVPVVLGAKVEVVGALWQDDGGQVWSDVLEKAPAVPWVQEAVGEGDAAGGPAQPAGRVLGRAPKGELRPGLARAHTPRGLAVCGELLQTPALGREWIRHVGGRHEEGQLCAHLVVPRLRVRAQPAARLVRAHDVLRRQVVACPALWAVSAITAATATLAL
mmetsp:Transcript_23992/g.74730  ORF Transcript_23992/g.74730 Transcript_23992/m.74730 type:complete len:218 (-) Transcript_23992:1214-1867(-)